MGFNSEFKGLTLIISVDTLLCMGVELYVPLGLRV